MGGGLIAALVLFGPAALALPAIAVAWHRGQRAAAAERAAFRSLRAAGPAAAEARPHAAPPTAPHAAPPAATVTELRRRRRAGNRGAGVRRGRRGHGMRSDGTGLSP